MRDLSTLFAALLLSIAILATGCTPDGTNPNPTTPPDGEVETLTFDVTAMDLPDGTVANAIYVGSTELDGPIALPVGSFEIQVDANEHGHQPCYIDVFDTNDDPDVVELDATLTVVRDETWAQLFGVEPTTVVPLTNGQSIGVPMLWNAWDGDWTCTIGDNNPLITEDHVVPDVTGQVMAGIASGLGGAMEVYTDGDRVLRNDNLINLNMAFSGDRNSFSGTLNSPTIGEGPISCTR